METEGNKTYDAIVIGSGIGGMTAATLLARAKKRVLLLERHTVPGGFSHTFKRKGYSWDVGVHYVGQMDKKNSILRRILDYVTEGQVHWTSLGEIYDEARIVGKRYPFYSDFQKHQSEL
ncbi:MAG: FAD-dependent oxidoreductase, partial [Proteobacteria bacterium]